MYHEKLYQELVLKKKQGKNPQSPVSEFRSKFLLTNYKFDF